MTWIATCKGRAFDLAQPLWTSVDFVEIGHALARICRWNGHTRGFYSVAEHSCRVADILPERMQIYGLLHDAHEAYMGDLTRPFKLALPEMAPGARGSITFALDEMARKIDEAIACAAGIASTLSDATLEAVIRADHTLLATEARDLLPKCDREILPGVKPLPEFIVPWTMAKAEREFARRFAKLTDARMRAA